MAAASLVASALGIVILIITAYVLVGGAVSTTDLMISAQKDMTALQLEMMGTSMEILSVSGTSPLEVYVKNSGNEPIRDFINVDVYVSDSSGIPVLFRYSTSGDPGTWKKIAIYRNDEITDLEVIHPNQWDPGEVIQISVYYSGSPPGEIQVTTDNGISTRSTL